MTKLIDVRVLILCMLVCFLCGCGKSTLQPSASYLPNQSNAAQDAERFLRLAGNGNTELDLNNKLRAAEQFIAAGNIEQAEQLLNHDLNRKLNTEDTAYKQILVAQLLLAKRDTNAAQQKLSAIWTPLKLPTELQVKFFSTRSEVYRRSGSLLEAVQERIYLSKHLKSAEEQKINNNAIWEILSQLTPNTLRLLQKDYAKDELNGWISFANITKQYDSSSEQKMRAFATWKQNFPNHPALSFMPEHAQQIPANSFESAVKHHNANLAKLPKKIALMLPLQGTHAHSAQAVRDGFLAAYYAQPNSPNKPKIQIYDTTTKSSLQRAYQEIVDEGADFIVGPLVKEDVENFSYSTNTDIPVLALNVILNRKAQENIFQFGLSPEMEAQAVAEKAWQDGHRNALIITPKSAWGARMQNAFQDHWLAMGGKILVSEEIESQSNLNKEVQHMLAIDESEARAKQLKQLGLKFAFEPRRRQDPDMIFIATNATLARQVKPLLNFYYAAKLPAYASSSVFTGKVQPSLDQDLNGIQFCDMPWILDDALKAKSTYKILADLWPDQFEQYARLYAVGLDAYKIALQLDQLTSLPNLGVSGMTGMLTMDAQRKIQRRLTWASFKKGIPYIHGEQA